MPKPKTIPLTLTEEEVELIEEALWSELYKNLQDIKKSNEYPESEYFGREAEKARVMIPALKNLRVKIRETRLKQLYPLCGGAKT